MEHTWDDTVRMHRAQYRDRIIDAAIALVAEEGVNKASMAGLAQKAGVGRATLYKYFASIECALLAHVEREVDDCTSRLATAVRVDADPLAGLRAYVSTLLSSFVSRRHRLGWATLDQAELSTAAMSVMRDQIARLYEPLVLLLARGVELGVLRGDIDPALHGRLALKMLMVLHDDLAYGAMTLDTATEAVVGLLTRGLLAPRADPLITAPAR